LDQLRDAAPRSHTSSPVPTDDTVSAGMEALMPPRSPTGATRGAFANRRVSELSKRDSELKRTTSKQSQEQGPNEPTIIDAEIDLKTAWHLMSTTQIKSQLELPEGALEYGLPTAEVAGRIQKYGRNVLTPPKKITILQRFLKNMFAPFSVIMQVAGVMCFIIVGINSETFFDVQTLALAVVLFGVAINTSIFQTTQEAQADNLVEALHALTAEKAWVFRDQKLVELDAAELVPGDRVQVQLGEKVPADIRILSCDELKVNCASLTGEDADVLLNPAAQHRDLHEAKNLAWSGCNFTSGGGVGVVFATGDNTRFGQIAHNATESVPPDTLMRREVKRLVIVMSILGATIAIAFLCASLGIGQTWQMAIILLIGLVVVNIPEGVLPQITIALCFSLFSFVLFLSFLLL
jgi:sodium/potassium-transporting ATPase subunit alpha